MLIGRMGDTRSPFPARALAVAPGSVRRFIFRILFPHMLDFTLCVYAYARESRDSSDVL